MAMNRETRRMLQRQGSLGADGEPVAGAKKRASPQAPKPSAKEQRLGPIKWAKRYWREVVAEMRKVSFPSREEVRSFSIIVFIFLVVVTSVVGILDFGVSHLVLKVFN